MCEALAECVPRARSGNEVVRESVFQKYPNLDAFLLCQWRSSLRAAVLSVCSYTLKIYMLRYAA